MSSRTSPLFRSEILGLFGNRFTADRMYPRHTWENLQKQVQTLLCQKQSLCSSIFIAFLECTQNFAHFEKKDQLHSLYNSEVIDPNNAVTSMPVSSCFRTPFASNHLHGSQTLLGNALQQFYPNFPLM